ncbi:MAG: UDP-N-acetylmuramate dehydrogenase [Gammaproteobacteria bacterium]
MNMTQNLQGKLEHNVSLADYTSWHVGGVAERFYRPAGIEDLAAFLSTLQVSEPITWLGLGSNVLIRDIGLKGTVIHTQGNLVGLEQPEPLIIRAEAGVACGQLARHTARLNLSGLEFMAGIPGSVGGALAMNAGCHGGETWQWVTAVETIDRTGQIRLRAVNDFNVGYRFVERAADEWFVAGYFLLKAGDKQICLQKIRELLDYRAATQPTNEPNCGSVFRNPPGNYAARLIEQSGLKGVQVGGAQVSEKHANFIVNTGTATAKDIESLIQLVQSEVLAKQHITLIQEVHFLGM